MSGLFSDLTEQHLEKLYDDFAKDQMRLMNEMKNCKEPEHIQKQLTILNSLMISVLKLRNLKKKIVLKGNSM